jgi:hypothetical protein
MNARHAHLLTFAIVLVLGVEREPPSVAADSISPDIEAGKWPGFTPPPLPE